MTDMDEMRQNIRQMFQWAVQALVQPAEVQRALFPPWVVVADELALDYDHWWTTFERHCGGELSREQREAAEALDALLEEMSGPKPELWTEEGCLNHPKWSEVRRLAANVLSAFGWSADVPPIGRSIYASRGKGIWPP
jgi:hypothetical protein